MIKELKSKEELNRSFHILYFIDNIQQIADAVQKGL